MAKLSSSTIFGKLKATGDAIINGALTVKGKIIADDTIEANNGVDLNDGDVTNVNTIGNTDANARFYFDEGNNRIEVEDDSGSRTEALFSRVFLDNANGGNGTWFDGDHDALTSVGSSDHHSRYSDSEARTAVEGTSDVADLAGGLGNSGNVIQSNGTSASWVNLPHDDLTSVGSSDHHSRYSDSEARTAVEGTSDVADLVGELGNNTQVIQSDGTNVSWVDLPHDDLTSVGSSDHHSRYSDSEARTAVEGTSDVANLVGGLGTNQQVMQSDGTNASWVTLPHDDLTSVGSSDHHTRYSDSEAITAIEQTSLTGTINNWDWYSKPDERILFRAQGTGGELGFYDDNTNTWVIRQFNSGNLQLDAHKSIITKSDVLLQDGTASDPSLAFDDDPDTGVYRVQEDRIGIATSGSLDMAVDGPDGNIYFSGNSLTQIGGTTDADNGAIRMADNSSIYANDTTNSEDFGLTFNGQSGTNKIQADDANFVLKKDNRLRFGPTSSIDMRFDGSDLIIDDPAGVELIRQPQNGPTEFLQGIDAGSIEAPSDSFTQLANASATSSASSGDRIGYTFAVDNQSVFSVEANSDGSGGITDSTKHITSDGYLDMSGHNITNVAGTNSATSASIELGSGDHSIKARDSVNNVDYGIEFVEDGGSNAPEISITSALDVEDGTISADQISGEHGVVYTTGIVAGNVEFLANNDYVFYDSILSTELLKIEQDGDIETGGAYTLWDSKNNHVPSGSVEGTFSSWTVGDGSDSTPVNDGDQVDFTSGNSITTTLNSTNNNLSIGVATGSIGQDELSTTDIDLGQLSSIFNTSNNGGINPGHTIDFENKDADSVGNLNVSTIDSNNSTNPVQLNQGLRYDDGTRVYFGTDKDHSITYSTGDDELRITGGNVNITSGSLNVSDVDVSPTTDSNSNSTVSDHMSDTNNPHNVSASGMSGWDIDIGGVSSTEINDGESVSIIGGNAISTGLGGTGAAADVTIEVPSSSIGGTEIDTTDSIAWSSEQTFNGGIEASSIEDSNNNQWFSEVVDTGRISSSLPAYVDTGITSGTPKLWVSYGVEATSVAANVEYQIRWNGSEYEVRFDEVSSYADPYVDYTIIRTD